MAREVLRGASAVEGVEATLWRVILSISYNEQVVVLVVLWKSRKPVPNGSNCSFEWQFLIFSIGSFQFELIIWFWLVKTGT